MRALTLNLHCWQEVDALAKLEAVADFIAQEQIDLVFLQEVGQSLTSEVVATPCGIPVREDNAARLIVQRLREVHRHSFDWFFNWAHVGFEKYEEGNAVLVRGQVRGAATHWLSESQQHDEHWSRNAVAVPVVLESGASLTAIATHTGWWDDARDPFSEQFNRLAQFVTDQKLRPVVVGVDLNAPAGGPSYTYMEAAGVLQDAYRQARPEGMFDRTFPGAIHGWADAEGARIDYLLTSRDFPWPASSARVVFDGVSEPMVSDHFGVMVEFGAAAGS